MNAEELSQVVPDTFPSMFWGYALIWGFYCVYLLVLIRRVNRITAQNK